MIVMRIDCGTVPIMWNLLNKYYGSYDDDEDGEHVMRAIITGD